MTGLTGNAEAQKIDPRADQAVGMFTKTCLRFPGAPSELRSWIKSTARLIELPAEKAIHFLSDRPGVAWPATNSVGEFVIVSHDDGLCTVFARRAGDTAVVQLLETIASRTSGYALTLKEETSFEGRGGTARTRIYAAKKGQLHLDVVITLSQEENAPFQAALSARPQSQ